MSHTEECLSLASFEAKKKQLREDAEMALVLQAQLNGELKVGVRVAITINMLEKASCLLCL